MVIFDKQAIEDWQVSVFRCQKSLIEELRIIEF